jgi:hypothetical protein
MTKTKETKEIFKFPSVTVNGKDINSITVNAPKFKQVKDAFKNVNLYISTELSLTQLAEISENFCILCGIDNNNDQVSRELVDNLDYKTVTEIGSFCMSFM